MTTIESQGCRLFTVGLRRRDLELEVPDRSWVADGEALLGTMVEYVETTGRRLRRGETFGYGFWLVRFEKGSRRRLALAELTADASGFGPGVALALRYWREQHEVCARVGAPFMPPRLDQMVAVSVGVYEGDPVQAVRYRAPDHMTGWHLATSRYNGDWRTMMVEHLYHLTAARPELARFVALPPGYRFDTSSGEDVWFDPEAAARPLA